MAKVRRNIIVRIIDFVLIIVTIVSSISLYFVLIAPYVNANETFFFAFFGLVAPVVYLANITLMVFWVVRSRFWFVVTLLPLLWGIWSVGEFIGFDWRVEYESPKRNSSKQITIASYNVYAFKDLADGSSTITQIADSLRGSGADIICFQEYSIWDSTQLEKLELILDDYSYRAYQAGVNRSINPAQSTAIYSKFPLRNTKFTHFEGSNNGFLVSDVIIRSDTIKLINAHLQTTSFNAVSHNKGVREVLLDKSNGGHVADEAVGAFARNFKLRDSQADSLSLIIERSLKPVIVVGDFNSPTKSYVYRTIRGDLSDAFVEKGVGYASTYRPVGGLFRIDYVLFDSESYRCLEYKSPDWSYSDHRAVIVKLERVKK